MEKTPLPSSLTNDERFIIEQIVAKFAVLYARMTVRYKTPQVLAETLSKVLSSRKYLAFEALLCGTIDEGIAKTIFFPQDLSKQLVQVTYIPGTYDYWNEGRLQTVKFTLNFGIKLKPKELTQILKMMTSLNIYVNIRGLKKINEQNRCNVDNRGDNKSRVRNRHIEGGYPSAYTITSEFYDLASLMKKPEAMALFKHILIATNLAFRLEKFMVDGLFYLCKRDQKCASSLFETSWPEILRKKMNITPAILVNRISSASEKDLERHSLELAELWSTVAMSGFFYLQLVCRYEHPVLIPTGSPDF
jgi:hypothetical protein